MKECNECGLLQLVEKWKCIFNIGIILFDFIVILRVIMNKFKKKEMKFSEILFWNCNIFKHN